MSEVRDETASVQFQHRRSKQLLCLLTGNEAVVVDPGFNGETLLNFIVSRKMSVDQGA
ncbi:MAG: hypothetical protein MZU97_26105 [Bacillus subtilis]|nr:hypothetical protein [Bacillus subtilis]